jgi:hypothetical protein
MTYVHYPRRGDAVEAWLRTNRESQAADSMAWHAIDLMLNDYRLRADYGKSISDDTEGLE